MHLLHTAKQRICKAEDMQSRGLAKQRTCKAEDMQSRGHAKQRICKAEDVLTLLCKLAACLCSRCRTGSPFAWSAPLCSMFCLDVWRAAHTHRFALRRSFELCYNATAGLNSLLSRCMHDLFCPALFQRCLSPALAQHFVWRS